VSAYEDGSTTQTTAGITDTEDFDGLTGVHKCEVDTSNAAYAAGKDYAVILSAATIDGKVVNAVLAHFALQARYDSAAPKKNVAYSFNVPMVLDTDHITPQTGKTLTVNVSKDGGGFSAAGASVSEIGNGVYRVTATATDMNADESIFRITATGCDPYLIEFKTQVS